MSFNGGVSGGLGNVAEAQDKSSIMSRKYNVHYSGHILVTAINGWQSVGDLRGHVASLVGAPIYNVQLFVCGTGLGRFQKIECKHLSSVSPPLSKPLPRHTSI